MNNKLTFEQTIIVPFNSDGDLETVKQSIHEGVKKVEQQLREDHPDARESEIFHSLWQIIITNWSITAIAASEWERRYNEHNSKDN